MCNIQPDSCEAIASALDPRFKSLAFLDEMAREDVFLEVKLLAKGHSGEAEEEQLEPPAKRPGIPETTDSAYVDSHLRFQFSPTALLGKGIVVVCMCVRRQSS